MVRNPLNRDQSIISLCVVLILILGGAHVYNLIVAREKFIQGELHQKQIAEMESEHAKEREAGDRREARLVADADRVADESRRVIANFTQLKNTIPTQTTTQDIATLAQFINRPDLPAPIVAPDASQIIMDRDYLKAIDLRMVELSQEVARIPALEMQLAVLIEKNINLENALGRQMRISREKDKAIEAFKKSARKSRFRRVLNHPATKVGIFAVGVYLGSR